MAEAKIIILLANWLGIPLWGYVLLNYWGEFESLVMMILGVAFGAVKIVHAGWSCYFFIKKSSQDIKMRELKIEEKENELKDE